jgi:hypothetical protein
MMHIDTLKTYTEFVKQGYRKEDAANKTYKIANSFITKTKAFKKEMSVNKKICIIFVLIIAEYLFIFYQLHCISKDIAICSNVMKEIKEDLIDILRANKK